MKFCNRPHLAAIWLIGAWLRIVRQARYYQIEEYMSGRYLRWAGLIGGGVDAAAAVHQQPG